MQHPLLLQKVEMKYELPAFTTWCVPLAAIAAYLQSTEYLQWSDLNWFEPRLNQEKIIAIS